MKSILSGLPTGLRREEFIEHAIFWTIVACATVMAFVAVALASAPVEERKSDCLSTGFLMARTAPCKKERLKMDQQKPTPQPDSLELKKSEFIEAMNDDPITRAQLEGKKFVGSGHW